MESTTQTPNAQLKKRFPGFAPRLIWIFFGAFVFALLATKSYSGVPLLFGALIAMVLYKFTKNLLVGRRIEVRLAAWVLFAIVSFSIYNTIWWHWGPLWMQFKWRWAEMQWLLQDRGGGRTPQETYELFSRAMRAGDFQKASTFIARSYHSDPGDWLETVEEKKREGALEEYIAFLQKPWSEYEELDKEMGSNFANYDPETGKMFIRQGTLATSSYIVTNVAGAPGNGDIESVSYSGDTILFFYNKATRRWKIELIQCDTCIRE